jgi:hypothetical protein
MSERYDFKNSEIPKGQGCLTCEFFIAGYACNTTVVDSSV